MEPALTSEEWKNALRYPPGVMWGFAANDGVMDRHRMAAMCLYGTPQGFTHHDVRALQVVLEMCRRFGASAETALSIADLEYRIAALLPPESK